MYRVYGCLFWNTKASATSQNEEHFQADTSRETTREDGEASETALTTP